MQKPLWLILGFVHLLGAAAVRADQREAPALSHLLGGGPSSPRDARLVQIADVLAELSRHPLATIAASDLKQAREILMQAQTRGNGSDDRDAVARDAELAWAYLSLAGRKLAREDAKASYRAAERALVNAETEARKVERTLAALSEKSAAHKSTYSDLSQSRSASLDRYDPRGLAPDFDARAQRAAAAARAAPEGTLRVHFQRLHDIWQQATRAEAERLLLDRKRAQVQQMRLAVMERGLVAQDALEKRRQADRTQAEADAAAKRVKEAYTAWLHYRFSTGKQGIRNRIAVLPAYSVLLDQARMWLVAARSLGTDASLARARSLVDSASSMITSALGQNARAKSIDKAISTAAHAMAEAEHALSGKSPDSEVLRSAARSPCVDVLRAASATGTSTAAAACDASLCEQRMCSFAAGGSRVPSCCRSWMAGP